MSYWWKSKGICIVTTILDWWRHREPLPHFSAKHLVVRCSRPYYQCIPGSHSFPSLKIPRGEILWHMLLYYGWKVPFCCLRAGATCGVQVTMAEGATALTEDQRRVSLWLSGRPPVGITHARINTRRTQTDTLTSLCFTWLLAQNILSTLCDGRVEGLGVFLLLRDS